MRKDLFIPAFSLAAQEKPAWLLEGIIPEKSFGVLYGKPKAGKSLLALHWALHLAHEGEPVLYIAGEGLGGYGPRLQAWHHFNNMELHADLPLLFTKKGINLGESNSVYNVIQSMKAHEVAQEEVFVDGEFQSIQKPIGLVVIDTLSRSIPGGDENDAESMTAAIQEVDRIREELGCAVLVIHHTTKDSTDDEYARERGSSALRGAADEMVHLATRSRILTVTAARDFEPRKTWFCGIETCLDSAVIKVQEAQGGTVGPVQQAILDALCDGPRTLAEISLAISKEKSNTHVALSKMLDRGLIGKVGRGTYTLVERTGGLTD
jgi:hypothetical protein